MSDRFRHECPDGCKVFVGNLDRQTKSADLFPLFGQYGRVRDIWLSTNPPGFGFVMFEQRGDARSAVRKVNDTRIGGRRVTVELATGQPRRDNSKNSYSDSRRRYTTGHRSRSRDRISRDRRYGDRNRSSDRRKNGKTDDRKHYYEDRVVHRSSRKGSDRSPVGRYDRNNNQKHYSVSDSPSNQRRRRRTSADRECADIPRPDSSTSAVGRHN